MYCVISQGESVTIYIETRCERDIGFLEAHVSGKSVSHFNPLTPPN